MRGLLVFGAFIILAATTLVAAQAGILAWVWVALMNPHKEVYGFITQLRLNYLVAIIAILSWLASAERKTPGANNTFIVISLFLLWTSVTTVFAYDSEFSYPFWLEFVKTCALLYLVAAVMNTRIRIHALILVIYISMAYWGVKGGGFSLLSGGRYLVFGPPGTHISDNNHLALALAVTIPLGYYLFKHSEHKLMRWGVAASSVLILVSVLTSYSRGALVALGAMGLYWLISKRQIKTLATAAILTLTAAVLLPDMWFDRMGTISEYSDDRSAQGRFDAWTTSFNIARADPLTGAGFTAIEIPQVYFSHNPDSILNSSKAAHSVYFQVMGDHGFVGLLLYLAIAAIAWKNMSRPSHLPSASAPDNWTIDLNLALKLSLIGFWVGGAFLSMAYYDLYFMLLVITGTLHQMAKRPPGETSTTTG